MRLRHASWTLVAAIWFAPSPPADAAQQPSQSVYFYALGAGIDGAVGVGDRTANMDVSASDVLDDLDFGARGSYRYRAEPWEFQLDVIYVSLIGEPAVAPGFARARVDLDQAMIGVDARYRVHENVELMFGARYWDYETEIIGPGPAGAVQRASGSQSWVDPLIGARLTIPIGSNWAFVGRGDIGGFGLGSDFAWHATAIFDWKTSARFSVLFGYRIFDVDFDDGSGANRFLVDLQQSGPTVGVAFSF